VIVRRKELIVAANGAYDAIWDLITKLHYPSYKSRVDQSPKSWTVTCSNRNGE
jgi:hypothetical protein